jgi:hypothetical protein
LIFGIHNPRFSYTKQVKDNEKKAEWENLMKRIEKWKKKEIELKEQGVPEDSLMHYQICYMLVWGYEDDKKEGETLEEYCARANNNLKEVLDELNKNK